LDAKLTKFSDSPKEVHTKKAILALFFLVFLVTCSCGIQLSGPFLQLLLFVSQIVSKYASSFGYSVHRNTTISIIMLIYSNNWPF